MFLFFLCWLLGNSNGIKFQQSKEENKYDYISLTGVPYHRIKNEAEDGVGNCGNKLSAAEASSSCATRSYDIVGDSSGDIDSEYNLLENNYSEVENRDIHSEYSLLENNFAEVESNESKKQQVSISVMESLTVCYTQVHYYCQINRFKIILIK